MHTTLHWPKIIWLMLLEILSKSWKYSVLLGIVAGLFIATARWAAGFVFGSTSFHPAIFR